MKWILNCSCFTLHGWWITEQYAEQRNWSLKAWFWILEWVPRRLYLQSVWTMAPLGILIGLLPGKVKYPKAVDGGFRNRQQDALLLPLEWISGTYSLAVCCKGVWHWMPYTEILFLSLFFAGWPGTLLNKIIKGKLTMDNSWGTKISSAAFYKMKNDIVRNVLSYRSKCWREGYILVGLVIVSYQTGVVVYTRRLDDLGKEWVIWGCEEMSPPLCSKR